jgi:hypothetical protein
LIRLAFVVGPKDEKQALPLRQNITMYSFRLKNVD